MAENHVDDHDTLKPDYPSVEEFRAALGGMVAFFRAPDSHSKAFALKCGWVVFGYAQSFIPDDTPSILILNTREPGKIADLLEGYLKETQKVGKTVPVGAFDWKQLALMILQLIAKLLGG